MCSISFEIILFSYFRHAFQIFSQVFNYKTAADVSSSLNRLRCNRKLSQKRNQNWLQTVWSALCRLLYLCSRKGLQWLVRKDIIKLLCFLAPFVRIWTLHSTGVQTWLVLSLALGTAAKTIVSQPRISTVAHIPLNNKFHSDIAPQLHSHTAAQWHNYTATQLHSRT